LRYLNNLSVTSEQLELIPDLVCWKWRWNVQPEKSVCHKMLDLGSGEATKENL